MSKIFPEDKAARGTPPARGAPAPSATILDLEGNPQEMASLWDGKKAVLVFYRGHW